MRREQSFRVGVVIVLLVLGLVMVSVQLFGGGRSREGALVEGEPAENAGDLDGGPVAPPGG